MEHAVSLSRHNLAVALLAMPLWASAAWCAEPDAVPNAPVRGVVLVEPGAAAETAGATPAADRAVGTANAVPSGSSTGAQVGGANAVPSGTAGGVQAGAASVGTSGTSAGVQAGAASMVPSGASAGGQAGVVPATRPVSAAAGGGSGGGEIRRSRTEGAATQPAGSLNGMVGGAVYETLRVVIALGLVLALIVGLKVVAGKVLGIRTGAGGPNRGVRVLSRTVVSPKQQLLLIQAGRRLILVSESAGQLTTLTEFTDPDEVAELSAQALGTAKNVGGGGGVAGGGFGSLLGKRARDYDDFEDDMIPDSPAAVPARRTEEDPEDRATTSNPELESLADRIKALNRRLAAS